MRFCQSFMTELYRHIGQFVDVPAGDIGVGAREIGYLFGQYKPVCDNASEAGCAHRQGPDLRRLSGPDRGHRLRPVLPDRRKCSSAMKNDSFAGKTVVISGSGNVAIFACGEGHGSWAPRWWP